MCSSSSSTKRFYAIQRHLFRFQLNPENQAKPGNSTIFWCSLQPPKIRLFHCYPKKKRYFAASSQGKTEIGGKFFVFQQSPKLRNFPAIPSKNTSTFSSPKNQSKRPEIGTIFLLFSNPQNREILNFSAIPSKIRKYQQVLWFSAAPKIQEFPN